MGLPATTWVELVSWPLLFFSFDLYTREITIVVPRDPKRDRNEFAREKGNPERAQKTLQKTSHNPGNLKRDILLSANEYLCAPFVPSCGNGFGFMD